MKTHPIAILLIATASAGPAGADGPPPTGDLARLQGSWRTEPGAGRGAQVEMEIRGDRAVSKVTLPDGKVVTVRSHFRLGEDARPKTWDWFDLDAKGAPGEAGQQAIYRLDGDTLTLCNGGHRGVRPAEFRAGDSGIPSLKVYRRIKAKE